MIGSCLKTAPRDLLNLCKSTILILRSSVSSFDFPIAHWSIGHSNECCQTNTFYAAKSCVDQLWSVMITNENIIGLGLVKLNYIAEPLA